MTQSNFSNWHFAVCQLCFLSCKHTFSLVTEICFQYVPHLLNKNQTGTHLTAGQSQLSHAAVMFVQKQLRVTEAISMIEDHFHCNSVSIFLLEKEM